MYKSKKFEDLTISDDFMFGIVMRDPKYCKPFLETILNIKISRIEYPMIIAGALRKIFMVSVLHFNVVNRIKIVLNIHIQPDALRIQRQINRFLILGILNA